MSKNGKGKEKKKSFGAKTSNKKCICQEFMREESEYIITNKRIYL